MKVTVFTLDVLDDADARSLLIRRLGAGRTSAEPETVSDVIRLCERLPLVFNEGGATYSVGSSPTYSVCHPLSSSTEAAIPAVSVFPPVQADVYRGGSSRDRFRVITNPDREAAPLREGLLHTHQRSKAERLYYPSGSAHAILISFSVART